MSNSYLNYHEEIALGHHSQKQSNHKFGHAPSGIQTTATDIWDRADATPTQQVWLAPTAARIHTIASSSASDDTAGIGVNSVVVHYMADWDSRETTETVTGDLNAGIAMANAAVMINRMVVVPQSTTTNVGGNVGTITATAATDTTITAAILPGKGQTAMAILGLPSIQKGLLYDLEVHIDKAQGAVVSSDFDVRVNPNPDIQTLAFIRKSNLSVQSNGNTSERITYMPPLVIVGPAIMKIVALASTSDVDGSANFDIVLADN